MICEVSPVFSRNYHSEASLTVNQGGARSGKTYSILQVIVLKYCLQFTGLIIDIVRKTQAEIRDTLLPDWEEILQNNMLNEEVSVYDITKHKATYLVYELNGNTIRFIGLDKAQKKRGSKRHILYINEINGITLEDWVQLSIRTMEKIYCDFNPSEEFFLHDVVFNGSQYVEINSLDYDEDRDNPLILDKETGRMRRKLTYEFIKSTYLDNIDFLTDQIISYIQSLIGMDHFYEQVYVHGNLTMMRGKIYSNYEFVDLNFWETELDQAETFYGLDVGYEHYMVLMEIKYYNEAVYERPLFFDNHVLDEPFLDAVDEMGISFNDDIYVDSAAPTMIKKLRNRGYNARKAIKDVKDGIRFCQSIKRFILNDGSKESERHISQMSKYKYKQTSDGKVLDGEPVKIDDDSPDAIRYGEYTHLRKRINRLGIH